MTGLAPKTLEVFDAACSLNSIQEFVLVGGTALSLAIHHRLSEDLDFCKWTKDTSAKNGISFKEIKKELDSSFSKVFMNVIDFDQVDFLLNEKVKIQFFNEVGYNITSHTDFKTLKGNLRIAPVNLIAAMKIKTMFQRTTFRDYYDIFVIVKDQHVSLSDVIKLACAYSSKLTSGLIIKRLTTHASFKEEKNFGLLSPKYDIKSEEIGAFFSAETDLIKATNNT